MKTIGYLGQIDKLYGVPATTRNWNTIAAILRILKGHSDPRAALYVRVSSGEQHTEMQERALREYVQRRGWVQHKIYRDKCTGSDRKPTRS